MSGIRTPLNTTPAVALGNQKWVKEILRVGPLHYNGKVFDVTPEYLDTVADAYRDGALKRVPFQLAGKGNEHDESPERRRGFIEGVWREGDKLKSLIELEDEANNLVSTDLSFPVSVLIKHDRTKGNTGQHWDAVLTHVLGTYDPVLDLDDWEPYLAASNQDADVIDFLALSTRDGEKEGDMPDSAADEDAPTEVSDAEIDGALALFDTELNPAESGTDPSSGEGDTDPSGGASDMPSLADLLSEASEDELRELRTRLDTISPATAAPTEDDVDDVEVSDAEIAEALSLVDDLPDDTAPDGEDEDTGTGDDEGDTEADDEPAEPEGIAAAHESLALANAQEQLSTQALQLSQMQARINESDWAEREAAYSRAGVPKPLIARAKPALHGNDTSLKLSQADKDRTARLVDALLLDTGKLLTSLGLSQGVVGSDEDVSAERAQDEQRKSGVAGHLAKSGLLPTARGRQASTTS